MSVAITGLVDEELVGALPGSLAWVCNNGMFFSLLLEGKVGGRWRLVLSGSKVGD